MKIIKQHVKLEWITPNALETIEKIGRVCYKSEDNIINDSAKKFIQNIIKRGHHAVLEHAYASFRIITDRGISHELVRHRIANYCQESTRYCNYSKEKFGNEISVIQPPHLDPKSYEIWYNACEYAEKHYFELLENNSPQIARSVLPTCLKTELVMTANFREWRHVLSLRADKAAHPQVREISVMIYNILMKHHDIVFGDLEIGND